MMRRMILLLLIASLPLLLASCAPRSSTRAFTLSDLDGAAVSLKSLQGKVVVLDFWATWCPPCREALPHTQALSESIEAKDGTLVILAVNQAESAETVRDFMEKEGYSFRVLLDGDGAVGDAFGVQGIPTFVVIGRDGNETWRCVGQDEEGLRQALTEALQ